MQDYSKRRGHGLACELETLLNQTGNTFSNNILTVLNK